MRSVFLITIILLSFVSCSSKKLKTEVQKEIASQPTLKDNSELYTEELSALKETETLKTDQRNKLSKLLKKSKEQNDAIDDEIMKTKAVLFKSLVSEKSSRAKINLIENQLIKLNRKKTRQTLGSYREARVIVGKNERTLDRTLEMIDNRRIYEF
ncbi:MAG: hypothetical protein EHM20_05260 [Alphaproteobacteria bacterium]|nr:MAG: hypothetical protein EHM20_05260 [Alphaproteobacteria bacterium]